MAHTVVIKLLGKNIGYPVIYKKDCSLWKLSLSFRLMDIENEYFLAKFQILEEFEKVLYRGPWILYRQYLTVQPFSLISTRPSHTRAWSLLGLDSQVFQGTCIRGKSYGK
ncbi:hypothetical protein PVK06_048781 [Gossypium arboreum]|uniref:DUF4283 domain-containing protein n=1 Tax=Gossypium arboreum TaxID=29729 RepID=A0ABR0MHE0_GOSAR|nr:hypothetical protein PVK06_048781 [Gossypium arboreum]